MNNTKNKLIKAFIFLIIILGVSAFVFFENKNREQEIYKIRKEISDASKLPNDEELLNKKTELLRKENLLNAYLFDKNNPIEFIEIVERSGSQNLLNTNVDKVDVAEDNIVMDVSATGSFDNIKNFILSLENLEKEIDIKSVRFSQITKEKEVYWSVNLNIIGKAK